MSMALSVRRPTRTLIQYILLAEPRQRDTSRTVSPDESDDRTWESGKKRRDLRAARVRETSSLRHDGAEGCDDDTEISE